MDGFPDDAPPPSDDDYLPTPAWPVASKRGIPARDHEQNFAHALEILGVRVRHNLMRHDLMELSSPRLAATEEAAQEVSLAWLRRKIATLGLSCAHLADYLVSVADPYHPVRDWIGSKPWDGQSRIRDLFETIQLAKGADRDLSLTMLRRWLIAAARAVHPLSERGLNAQGVLVFQGGQNTRKTRWAESLAPPELGAVLTGTTIDPHDRDSLQQATTSWIVELGELDATFRKADVAALKAFVTRSTDRYRSAYARRECDFARRSVFIASVNDPLFLTDETGNRRWWTIPIVATDPEHRTDMQQLWAEAYALAGAGERWWIDDDEQAKLAEVNADHMPPDAIESEIMGTWELGDLATVEKTFVEVYSALPSFKTRIPSPSESRRMGQVLVRMGARRRTSLGSRYLVMHRAQVPHGHVGDLPYRDTPCAEG